MESCYPCILQKNQCQKVNTKFDYMKESEQLQSKSVRISGRLVPPRMIALRLIYFTFYMSIKECPLNIPRPRFARKVLHLAGEM